MTTETPFGNLNLFAKGDMLIGSSLNNENIGFFEEKLKKNFGANHFALDRNDKFLKEVERQYGAYFNGKLTRFDIKIPKWGDSFTDRVLHFVSQIPYGYTASYKDVAFALNSGAVRAVGSALGKNPFSILVPAHRVVRSGGSVGSYGSSKLSTKLALLRLEGVNL